MKPSNVTNIQVECVNSAQSVASCFLLRSPANLRLRTIFKSRLYENSFTKNKFIQQQLAERQEKRGQKNTFGLTPAEKQVKLHS